MTAYVLVDMDVTDAEQYDRYRPLAGASVEQYGGRYLVRGGTSEVLEGERGVLKYRDVMGATDPSKAADGTIRKVHAKSIGENSVHGSDATETAAIEIAQFFSGNEIVG